MQILLGGAGAPGGPGGAGGDPPGVIRVTPEEKAAIERLQALGFSRHRALEAFLACDKNEEFAANYLFENMEEFAALDQEEEAEAAGVPPGAAGAGAQIPPFQAQPPAQPAQAVQPPAQPVQPPAQPEAE